MGFLILGIMAAIIAILALMRARDFEDSRMGVKVTMVIAGLVSIGLFMWGFLVSVDVGHVAVMSRFGRVTGEVLQSGLHGKAIIDTANQMSIMTQLFSDDATAASKDLQDVTATIAINYKLDPSKAANVFRTVGREYIKIIAHPLIQETVKEVTSRYNAEDMILRRAEVKLDITNEITDKLAERGIIAEAINITNFSFSDVFDSAIEAKVVAVQKALESENKLRQIEVEARQAEQKAKGEAAADIARAEGRAKANAIIDASLTEKVLRYMFIDKMGGDVKVWVVPENQVFTVTP